MLQFYFSIFFYQNLLHQPVCSKSDSSRSNLFSINMMKLTVIRVSHGHFQSPILLIKITVIGDTLKKFCTH